MTDPKPTTNDILAKIRGGAGSAGPADEKAAAKPDEAGTPPQPGKAADEAASTASESAAPKPATPSGTADILAAARAKAKPAAATPGSTADILAAARAKATPGAGSPAPAKSGAAPKSPADIMAAIRGGGSPAAASAAPAKTTGTAQAAAPSAPTGRAVPAGLSPAEMIRKAREGSAAGTPAPTAPKVALPAKPLPGKKPAAAAPADTRRDFLSQGLATILSPVVIAWASFATAATASALAVARFMMPNVLVEPPTKFKIGPPNDYAPGTVSTKWQAQFGVWIVNAEVDGNQQIYALSTVCTHLGCTPNWLEGEQKFKCPCHGSGFYKTGVNFEGPAPRPLERFGLRLAEDGMLEVDKGLKFQKELGQWANPACFVPVV